jgi:AraC-like DNA-binding protein
VIGRALDQARWPEAVLGGPRWPDARRGDPAVTCLPMPRITIVLEGTVRYGFSHRGERRVVEGGPGQVFAFASHAWNLSLWGTRVRFLGLVFRRDLLRVLLADVPARGPTGPARTAHHTRLPLAGPATGLLGALDALADLGPAPALQPVVGDLCRGLARLAQAHVAEDLAGPSPLGSLRTWQEAMEHLGERLLQDVSRESVAKALGLHPNYLSALFTRHGGASFQRTVEGLRLERAKALLRADPDLAVAEVGRRCGYRDAGHFIRVFRRRVGRTPGRFARR